MPPKRKAAAGGTKGKGAKKSKAEELEAPATLKDAAAKLKAEDKKKGGKKSHKIDSQCSVFGGTVHEDFDCMLNQTNIGHNNNKFYVIQVVSQGANYYCWTRWGRVGESGQNALKGPTNLQDAIKEFEKKFKDKTKNSWADREKFVAKPGKYTLIEMADEEEDEVDAAVVRVSTDGKKLAASKLDKPTQSLLELIFNKDMFKDTMQKFDIDVKKMPLGKLSKGQIAKGFEVLDEIENDLKSNKKTRLKDLSSQFYTVIPHNFGRQIPPVMDNMELLRNKMDMLLVLGDIEIAQSLQKEKDKKLMAAAGEVPNPLDVDYGLLNCELELLDKNAAEYKVIETYTKETSGGWRNPKIQQVWKVNRDGDNSRFIKHDKLGNRKLLWHGTSVAVVAAIMKGGLRIMPHSGGRVGRGIYFASENSKSACYVGTSGKNGIMFLNEVALGKQNEIQQDNSSLKNAPNGYDSVLAKGRTEPDPKKDTTLKFDGKTVTVPQGKPVTSPGCTSSSFSQSEYLIYKESQNRIRYLLLMEF